MLASKRAREFDAVVARRPSTMWSSLPGAQQLEVCAFLDPLSLGCLELCGSRQFEEARARAWMQAAAGTPRGALAMPSDKQFLAAHTRLRSLYPTSMQQARGFGDLARDPDEHALLEDFAFTFVFSWEELEGSFHTAAFEHLRCNDPRLMERFGSISTFFFGVSDADPGRNILKRKLLESQEMDNAAFTYHWQPVVSQYCTRKRDGVTIKIAEWDWFDSDINLLAPHGLGSISFRNGLLNLDHEMETYSTLNVLFEKATGRLRCLTSTHFEEDDDPDVQGSVSKLIFRALLLAKFEDATADNPPVPA